MFVILRQCEILTRRFCFYHIRYLRHIRCYISLSVAKTIAIALITSRLDYCNSLLYYIASKDIQNFIVFRTAQLGLSDGLLGSLILAPTSKSSSLAPCSILLFRRTSCLFSMLSLSPKPRELRLSGFHLLSVPRVKTHAGTYAFSVAVFAIHSLNMLSHQNYFITTSKWAKTRNLCNETI